MDGVFGVYDPGNRNIVSNAYLGTGMQQHRGKVCAGIAVGNGDGIYIYKKLGRIGDVITPDIINTHQALHPSAAIGNLGYTKSGSAQTRNAEPIEINPKTDSKYQVVLTFDGYLVGEDDLKDELEEDYNLNTSCKTEVVGALFHNYIKKHGVSFEAGRELLDKLKGRATFAMTALVYDGEQTHMISLKDSTGFEPMCFGSIDNAFVVASESCSHRRLGSYSDREYLGGEMTICNSSGVDTQRLRNDPQLSDIFQGVYFGNPGSLFQDKEIYQIRRQLGLQLVDLYKTSKADIVIPNPDSGWGVTMGIAEGLGKNVYPALIKLAQAVRTFQEMEKVQRFREVGLKFGGIDSLLTGTNIAMGDDSIVKGSVGEGGSIAVLLNAEIKSLEFWVSYAPMMFPSFKEWHHKKTSLDILAVQRAFNGDTPYDKTHEEINEAVARLIVSRMNEIKPGDYDIEVKYNTLERIKKVTGKGSFQALDPKTYPIDEKFWPTWLKEEVEKFEKLRVH